MLHQSPLRKRHDDAARADAGPASDVASARPGAATGFRTRARDIEYLPYGPPDADAAACEIVAAFGDVEPEYASLRRAAGLMDWPQRGTLIIEGDDRRDFLNRLITQKVVDLAPGVVAESFLLNRKGRIDADLVLVETGNRILVDLDRAVAASTAAALDAFLFTEDVRIADRSDAFHQVQVHGPRAHEVLAAALGESEPIALDPHCAGAVTLAGVDVVVLRRDLTGEPGYAIIMPRDGAGAVWAALLETDAVLAEGRRRIRPVGWYAFNVARIEAGTPLFNIDFGATNLPHETGLIDARVHFAKGCYVGQEVVARMHNLGRPKQILVGLRMRADRLPVADGQVFAPGDDGAIGTPVGVVTSSTLSPMLGAAPIAFAMIRTVVAEAGRPVLVNAEGEQVEADLGPLAFWTPGAPGAST